MRNNLLKINTEEFYIIITLRIKIKIINLIFRTIVLKIISLIIIIKNINLKIIIHHKDYKKDKIIFNLHNHTNKNKKYKNIRKIIKINLCKTNQKIFKQGLIIKIKCNCQKKFNRIKFFLIK